jgi:hypothetical protein
MGLLQLFDCFGGPPELGEGGSESEPGIKRAGLRGYRLAQVRLGFGEVTGREGSETPVEGAIPGCLGDDNGSGHEEQAGAFTPHGFLLSG